MATIKLTITVDKLTNVLSLFDHIKVYRSVLEAGPYAEITIPVTRINLTAGQVVYYYDDVAGDPAWFYKTSYFNSITLLESSLSDSIQGEADPLYVSVQDVRDEGISVATASDARLLMLIWTWQQYVERACRQWFVPRQITWDFDGNGTTLAQFPVPIISVSELHVNDDFSSAIPTADYKVYTDRRNPRIKLVTRETSIFEGVGPVNYERLSFLVGEKNQRVVGSFGYVEADGSTPSPIQYAVRKLVCGHVGPMGASAIGSTPAGPVIEEETDRHRRRWADPYVGAKVWFTTGDAEVDQIIAFYRAPISMRAPRTMFRRLNGGSIYPY